MGSADGIIIATIMASHISRKLPADASHVWPLILIHIVDILQPPGISISQQIERQKWTVAATLAKNPTAQTAMNATGTEMLSRSYGTGALLFNWFRKGLVQSY